MAGHDGQVERNLSEPAVSEVASSWSAAGAPPEASAAARALARWLLSPIESFLRIEAGSGIALMVAAALAMIVANSPWSEQYHRLLSLPIGFNIGSWEVERSLHFWVNDGLMTIFFFVVGLEIRREVYEGELSTFRRAVLPFAAALGGMLAPALIYTAIAGGVVEYRAGWGVPMATDIAFAVGVLALLGKRVPSALRVLLLALAILDDVGGIIVIALFYSGPLAPSGFAVAAVGVALIAVMQRFGVRRPLAYVVPGVVVWAGVLWSGVHPTISGVLVGLLTPARVWLGAPKLAEIARRSAERVERALAQGTPDAVSPERLAEEAAHIRLASREALAPAVRLQMALHPWVAFGIMPIFAFANAGVTLDARATTPSLIGVGIVLGLVLGKPIGILVVCFAVVKAKIAALPRGIAWRELTVLGVVAGVGFTMALFIAALAFPGEHELEQAKAAVLSASVLAMAISLLVGRLILRPALASEARLSPLESKPSVIEHPRLTGDPERREP